MKYLIDTQALAYYLYAGKQLPKTVKEFIQLSQAHSDGIFLEI